MVDFRLIAPVNEQKRREAAARVTKLANGAHFKFEGWTQDFSHISGRYRDFTGEMTALCFWDSRGRVFDRTFAEFDLDWSTAREVKG